MSTEIILSERMAAEQNQSITETIRKERNRLLGFIRKRVPREEDAEDILQDVFIEFTESYRLPEPIEKITGWLFTTARNKITDLFRKKKPESLYSSPTKDDEEGERLNLSDLLPDSADGPEALFARKFIMNELWLALGELPEEQKSVFILHELDEVSFKDISMMEGVSVNTLLSRKRYAVLFLRERLKEIYSEFITLKN